MFLSLITLSLIGFTADEKTVPPAKKELFAKADWYKSAEGKEQTFIGVLSYTPRKEGIIGFGRFNPYQLDLGKGKGIREVHIAGEEKILAEYHGKKVKLTGKAIDMEVEGRNHKEIWPARVELLEEKIKDEPKKEECGACADAPKIAARAQQFSGIQIENPMGTTIRSEKELAKLMGTSEADAVKQATEMLKVKSIDFEKQTLIHIAAGQKPSGGYSVDVTGVEMKDKNLVIKWKVNSPGPNDIVTLAITYPAILVLIDGTAESTVFDPKLKANP